MHPDQFLVSVDSTEVSMTADFPFRVTYSYQEIALVWVLKRISANRSKPAQSIAQHCGLSTADSALHRTQKGTSPHWANGESTGLHRQPFNENGRFAYVVFHNMWLWLCFFVNMNQIWVLRGRARSPAIPGHFGSFSANNIVRSKCRFLLKRSFVNS